MFTFCDAKLSSIFDCIVIFVQHFYSSLFLKEGMNGLPARESEGADQCVYLGYGKFKSNCLMKCRNMFKI